MILTEDVPNEDVHFYDRLKAFITDMGKTISRVGTECGFSKGSLGIVIRQKRAIGSDRLIMILRKYPTLNADWLMTGRGEMIFDRLKGQMIDTLQRNIGALERAEQIRDNMIVELNKQLDSCKCELEECRRKAASSSS